MVDKQIHLVRWRTRLEQQMNWGPCLDWTTGDFERLSEAMFRQTGVRLSVTTLKRVVGKLAYRSEPAPTTLDAMAQFIGYDTWRAFLREPECPVPTSPPLAAPMLPQDVRLLPPPIRVLAKPRRWQIIGLSLVLMGLTLTAWYYLRTHNSASPVRYSFSSKKVVSAGVPNTVIFEYDARSSPTDSVFLQQSWDPTRRVRLAKEGRQATAIYYTPGFFQAKLVVGHQVVEQHNLFITSGGWLPVLNHGGPQPLYPPLAEVLKGGVLRLRAELMAHYQLDKRLSPPGAEFYNVRRFPEVTTQNFDFAVEVRNECQDGTAICRATEVSLLTEGSALVVPLSAKGCVSKLSLLALDRFVSGQTADLSGFGVDFSDWVHLRLLAQGKWLSFYVNNQLAYRCTTAWKRSPIVGIRIGFEGRGAARHLVLKANHKLVYQDL